MTDPVTEGNGPSPKSGDHFLTMPIITTVLLGAPLAIHWCSPDNAAIVLSWLGIAATAAILLGFFGSLLVKGLGPSRGIIKVLYIAAVGIASLILHFAALYRWTGMIGPGDQHSTSWADAFYFSVVTWTTLGYGDFRPVSEARYIVIVEVMLGYVIMALLISTFVSTIQRQR